MLGEVTETEATGQLAVIYRELRTCSGVPYVSSLQRHIASLPNCLEYAWGVCRPAFMSGALPETAWRLASTIPADPLPPLSEAALRLMGVDAAGTAQIRNICDYFVRVPPVNLLFAGCFERLIEGVVPGGGDVAEASWQPPEMLPAVPAMVDPVTADPDVAAVLHQLATEISGKPFIPGLYRMLAQWPGYFAHAASEIAPMLHDAQARAERAVIAEKIVGAADEIIVGLPTPADDLVPPTAEQGRIIVDAIRTYRVTSPEMILCGMLLRDALPKPANGGPAE